MLLLFIMLIYKVKIKIVYYKTFRSNLELYWMLVALYIFLFVFSYWNDPCINLHMEYQFVEILVIAAIVKNQLKSVIIYKKKLVFDNYN